MNIINQVWRETIAHLQRWLAREELPHEVCANARPTDASECNLASHASRAAHALLPAPGRRQARQHRALRASYPM